MNTRHVNTALRILERVSHSPVFDVRAGTLFYRSDFVGPPEPLGAAYAIGAAKATLELAVQSRRQRRPRKMCIDCGEVGVLTGHQECQYPGRAGGAS